MADGFLSVQVRKYTHSIMVLIGNCKIYGKIMARKKYVLFASTTFVLKLLLP
jgi:hypothetical protein